jgi:hypothetical protein
MKGIKKLSKRNTAPFLLVIFAMLAFQSTAPGKLATNKLATNRLSPFSAAANNATASNLAGSPVASAQLGPNQYAANPETTRDFLTTPQGREVLSYIVGCALPNGLTLVATGTDGTVFEFFGEVGLAEEWLHHPLHKAGRGWVSACLFARVNDQDVSVPISMRGPHEALDTTPDEEAGWPLEEGAFYGDYFVAPGEPIQWVACRGRDLAAGESGGLAERNCARPDPNNPGRTLCGFTYAGDCGDFAGEPVCKHLSGGAFYRNCHDNSNSDPHSDQFRQVITTFAPQ